MTLKCNTFSTGPVSPVQLERIFNVVLDMTEGILMGIGTFNDGRRHQWKEGRVDLPYHLGEDFISLSCPRLISVV